MNASDCTAIRTIQRHVHVLVAVLASLSALAALTGCSAMRLNIQRADEGLTIVLPGIDGRGLHNENICRRLAAEGVPTAIELYDWTSMAGMLVNQTAMSRNRRAAQQLADHIADYRREYPGRPVFLVGHSGGTAIAVWAAEAMPSGQEIDGVILMGSSLSPQYDLSVALARTRRLVNFYSYRDAALLGAGCRMVGTMDRQFTEAAGKVGFEASGSNMTQIPFDRSMEAAGLDGSHLSYCSSGFVTAYVAPLIKGGGHRVGPAIATASPTR